MQFLQVDWLPGEQFVIKQGHPMHFVSSIHTPTWPFTSLPCYFFFLMVLGLELRAYALSHSASSFLCWVFSRWGLTKYLLGWLWTIILLISATWVARIIGMSHWWPAPFPFRSLLRFHLLSEISLARLSNTVTYPPPPWCWPSWPYFTLLCLSMCHLTYYLIYLLKVSCFSVSAR
jgi:hypothetical protein